MEDIALCARLKKVSPPLCLADQVLTSGRRWQEHGVLRAAAPLRRADLPIGSALRIVPNHSCLAAALFERYAVIRGGDVVDEWRPVKGW